MKNERLQQLENILGMPYQHEHRDSTGRITYDFPAGILYENLELLMTCIEKGLDYDVSFNGLLPRTVIVNGEQIITESIFVSWLDQALVRKQLDQEIKDFFKDKYV